ncbi:hypothetical protein ACR55_01836 [Bordetella hinzii]|uniref:Uncharacterized protein n=1 Tax=Bordetella hinzii TaxID=103855 RepID=A0AAN1S0J2_9BORD|nr:hypothetical protein [Bordetella hinzii]AKQ59706.1 hypothetical protein ACR55_01836 [Bordetella hinzii]AZW19170.1 hypothetical protein CS347_21620 [Bordetella hinzii]
MGTRADFYVGRGDKAEWLGSVAWDGYPDGFERDGLLNASTEQQFREAVADELASRLDGTTPEMGWPWPWEDSHTTDYAYAFDFGKVYGSCGDHWFDAHAVSTGAGDDETAADDTPVKYPNMTAIQNVDFGSRSGVIFIGG